MGLHTLRFQIMHAGECEWVGGGGAGDAHAEVHAHTPESHVGWDRGNEVARAI